MRTAVPIDLYCYADIDYTVTVIAVCCNVLYKTHLIAYDGQSWAAEQGGTGGTCTPHLFWKGGTRKFVCIPLCGKWICTVLNQGLCICNIVRRIAKLIIMYRTVRRITTSLKIKRRNSIFSVGVLLILSIGLQRNMTFGSFALNIKRHVSDFYHRTLRHQSGVFAIQHQTPFRYASRRE